MGTLRGKGPGKDQADAGGEPGKGVLDGSDHRGRGRGRGRARQEDRGLLQGQVTRSEPRRRHGREGGGE